MDESTVVGGGEGRTSVWSWMKSKLVEGVGAGGFATGKELEGVVRVVLILEVYE